MKVDRALTPPQNAVTAAVFIDADNVSARHAQAILSQSGPAPRLLRAYGDVSRGAKAWEVHAAVELIHTGTGKNASDVALAVDAMDVAHSGGLTNVYICTADGDFRHLARRLRAMGIIVTGMGVTGKTAKSFRDACSNWLPLIEAATTSATQIKMSDDALSGKLRAFIANQSKKGAGAAMSDINQHATSVLAKEDETVKTRWRACLGDPKRFAIDRKDGAGGKLRDPMVRFLPDGFAAQT